MAVLSLSKRYLRLLRKKGKLELCQDKERVAKEVEPQAKKRFSITEATIIFECIIYSNCVQTLHGKIQFVEC